MSLFKRVFLAGYLSGRKSAATTSVDNDKKLNFLAFKIKITKDFLKKSFDTSKLQLNSIDIKNAFNGSV